jgi:GDPmannose 4,6-dehydratase
VKNSIAVIFGSGGQDGYYLRELLKRQEVVTVNISRKGGELSGDVGDYEFVAGVLEKHRPDFIFHLAANSTVRHDVMFENHRTISTGSLNILEGARLYCPSAKIFLSGSALQFRNIGEPINERALFDAESPYAVSRLQSVYAGRYFRSAFGLRVYFGYFFNHDSPLRTEHHVNQKIVRAVQRIAGGSGEKLVLGNIDVRKEFNYAGDAVNAVWTLVNQEEVFEAVIGSGKAYRILDWLEYCCDRKGIKWRDAVVLEDKYVPQYQVLVSDPGLIMGLGWRPEVDIYELANMMLDA